MLTLARVQNTFSETHNLPNGVSIYTVYAFERELEAWLKAREDKLTDAVHQGLRTQEHEVCEAVLGMVARATAQIDARSQQARERAQQARASPPIRSGGGGRRPMPASRKAV